MITAKEAQQIAVDSVLEEQRANNLIWSKNKEKIMHQAENAIINCSKLGKNCCTFQINHIMEINKYNSIFFYEQLHLELANFGYNSYVSDQNIVIEW